MLVLIKALSKLNIQIEMKKIIFLVLCVLFIYPHHTSAQFLTGFGIKGGVTFAYQIHEYSTSFSLDKKDILGFNGSIFSEFLHNRLINLYAETGFEQRGYALSFIKTDEFGNTIGEDELKYRTNYIFASFGTKLKYQSKYFTPYFLFQPRVSFYLGYTQKFPDGFIEFDNSILEDFKKVMFDIGIGAGIEFNRLLPFRTSIEANYFPELITSYSSGILNAKEHSFNIKLGINFIKDKKKK
jgi:Outer membrane protein beta-barrel domain